MDQEKNKRYWEERFLQVEALQALKADKYQEEVERQYLKVMLAIQRDIEAFYGRYAQAEGIDYITAKKNLSRVEKEQWEVSLEAYRQMALDEAFKDQLESMYSKSRVSRLQALQTQIQARVEVLHHEGVKGTEQLLADTFIDTYYRTIFEIQKGVGIGANFATYNQDAVNLILNKPWKGSNFSDRWGTDKTKLLDELETALTHAFIRGDSLDKTIDTVTKRMKRSRNWAANLIQTESAFIAGQATALGYEQSGIEEYEYLATLDLKTSDICRDLDGEPFKLKDKKVGVNYPPMHCRCRSTTVPLFKDIAQTGERIARGSDGKSYYVPESMTYHEWYEKYVKSNSEELAAEKKHNNRHNDKKQYENYKKVLGKESPKTFNNFQELKYGNPKKWEELKLKKSLTAQLNKLTDDEREVLTRYTGYLANNVNSALGTRNIARIKKYADEIRLLDSALAKGVIPEDITIIRKTIVGNMNLPKGFELSLKTMEDLRNYETFNDIFTSTAFKDFDHQGRDVFINLKVPKGYKGALYIKPLAHEKYKYQEEMLFHRGLKYRINHVSMKEGIYYMDAEVIQ